MEKTNDIKKETSSRTPVRVGISIGDVNGIGPEVIMKALSDNRILLDCTPIIYGSTTCYGGFPCDCFYWCYFSDEYD